MYNLKQNSKYVKSYNNSMKSIYIKLDTLNISPSYYNTHQRCYQVVRCQKSTIGTEPIMQKLVFVLVVKWLG